MTRMNFVLVLCAVVLVAACGGFDRGSERFNTGPYDPARYDNGYEVDEDYVFVVTSCEGAFKRNCAVAELGDGDGMYKGVRVGPVERLRRVGDITSISMTATNPPEIGDNCAPDGAAPDQISALRRGETVVLTGDDVLHPQVADWERLWVWGIANCIDVEVTVDVR